MEEVAVRRLERLVWFRSPDHEAQENSSLPTSG
jgi:hypothetical protein